MEKINNFAPMNKIWHDALKIGVSVTERSVIYRGVKFEMEDGTLNILSTARDFYEPLPHDQLLIFETVGFDTGMNNHLRIKYGDQIKALNKMIQQELAYRRNQKRIEYLKNTRNECQSKINKLT